MSYMRDDSEASSQLQTELRRFSVVPGQGQAAFLHDEARRASSVGPPVPPPVQMSPVQNIQRPAPASGMFGMEEESMMVGDDDI